MRRNLFVMSLPWAMVAFVLLLLVIFPARSEVWVGVDQDGDSTRLTEEPCTDPEVLKHIHESVHHLFMAGTSVVGGEKFNHCWRRYGDIGVFLVYADGDKGWAPWSTLKPEM